MTLVHTKVTLRHALAPEHRTSRALHAYATHRGWQVQQTAAGWCAICYDDDAQDVKDALRQAGFADSDFQIYLEYQRAWGFL